MNTRFVMQAAAGLLGAIGVACLFLPEAVLSLYDPTTRNNQAFLVQLLGATFLGFATLNWTAKNFVLGGIYGHAVLIGNFWHFTVGSLLTLRASLNESSNITVWLTLLVYGLFGIAFGVMLFASPSKTNSPPSG